jgi:hypothetical protein
VTVPDPLAADARVDVDPDSRTLIVRPATDADGYAKLLWRQGHQAIVEAEESYSMRGPSALGLVARGGARLPAAGRVRIGVCGSSSTTQRIGS